MIVVGIILAIIFILFGIGVVCLYTLPHIIAEIKCFRYKTIKLIEDTKTDIDIRSESRRKRLEIKRKRDMDLADKKLDAKLTKVNKKIQAKERKLNKLKGIQEEITSQYTSPIEDIDFDIGEGEQDIVPPPVAESTSEE